MLFAAGFGTRMGDLTAHQPKPMIPVAGKPLIDHALTWVDQAGLTTKVANLHYKPDALREHLAPLGVQVSVELPDILETGGGLRHALPLLGNDPVFTMNTDAVWAGPNPITLLREHWQPDHMDALLMCLPLKNAIGHKGSGDFVIQQNGQLKRGPGHIYSGLQIIKTDTLDQIQDSAFSLNSLWNIMDMNNRLFGMEYPGQWCDVGHPQGIAQAEDMLASHNV